MKINVIFGAVAAQHMLYPRPHALHRSPLDTMLQRPYYQPDFAPIELMELETDSFEVDIEWSDSDDEFDLHIDDN